MFVLNQEKLKGNLKMRILDGEVRQFDKKSLVCFLKEEKEKEVNSVRKQDYEILIGSMLGIDSLILKKTHIDVIFDQEARWRQEAEAKITENNVLIQKLKEFFKSSTNMKSRRVS